MADAEEMLKEHKESKADNTTGEQEQNQKQQPSGSRSLVEQLIGRDKGIGLSKKEEK